MATVDSATQTDSFRCQVSQISHLLTSLRLSSIMHYIWHLLLQH